MKRATAFRVCPPRVPGQVSVFARAVVTERRKTGGSGQKVNFVAKK